MAHFHLFLAPKATHEEIRIIDIACPGAFFL